MQDLLTLLVILFVLIAVVVIFVRVALRIRRNGGSLTTTVFAATYDFYNKDKPVSRRESHRSNQRTESREEDGRASYG